MLDPVSTYKRLSKIEWFMQRSIALPLFKKRGGATGVLDFIPVVGDGIAGLIGAYIIYEAMRLEIPKLTLFRMIMNLGINTTLGAVPVVGSVWDFMFPANSRNLKMLKDHLEKMGAHLGPDFDAKPFNEPPLNHGSVSPGWQSGPARRGAGKP